MEIRFKLDLTGEEEAKLLRLLAASDRNAGQYCRALLYGMIHANSAGRSDTGVCRKIIDPDAGH